MHPIHNTDKHGGLIGDLVRRLEEHTVPTMLTSLLIFTRAATEKGGIHAETCHQDGLDQDTSFLHKLGDFKFCEVNGDVICKLDCQTAFVFLTDSKWD